MNCRVKRIARPGGGETPQSSRTQLPSRRGKKKKGPDNRAFREMRVLRKRRGGGGLLSYCLAEQKAVVAEDLYGCEEEKACS